MGGSQVAAGRWVLGSWVAAGDLQVPPALGVLGVPHAQDGVRRWFAWVLHGEAPVPKSSWWRARPKGTRLDSLEAP